ncbi:thioredoxin domain-containing protein [Sulfurimonas crateris]|uniref:Thioredoxin domain-containing protein n=1 Tax=Sulfurimonas crateris TaxID=2574727 RepID=A0A4U2ZAJ0_9BACT|nr:thioredoxin domain-containing protein [Sulfurimonas crateris]TKI71204.1 thioredoxin domain-containing protein [Sulfurimonas crateris]
MKIITLIFFLSFFVLFRESAAASNSLAKETSPYLLQHKDNPVDWHPWGEEAFLKAKKENKLIFLSIGYSTCHWCHVMAHESFENEHFAKLLNKYFISIKVDREELPHIDAYYQKVYATMNSKGGGWPLTIMMTADKKPFFSGTYVPLSAGYGSRGLMDIINSVATISHQKLAQMGEKVLLSVEQSQKFSNHKAQLMSGLANKTISDFKSYYDFNNSGFSNRPKFPEASKIILLLKLYEITKNKESLDMSLSALDAMAKGGIYDQIEGGFYRYTVDEKWQIPHFEKMLYTNGELLEAYSLAYKHTKNPLYKKIIDETIAQMDKRFQIGGVYMSASNADSKNREGKNEEGFYFVYEHDEAFEYLKKRGLKESVINAALGYLGITEDGNFEGHLSNPHITADVAPKALQRAKELLLEMRKTREYPFVDNKINTAWNALYIKGKFKAAIADKKYVMQAKKSLDALLEKMYVEGELYHQSVPNVKPTQKALLEDYAFLTSALFEAYQATLEQRYFKLYKEIVEKSITLFYREGRWLESNDGFVTYADISERAYASALAQQSINLLNYATVLADMKKFAMAKEIAELYSATINASPSSYPTATLASLMFEYEPIFIKSTKSNLDSFDANDIKYPFVYRYVYDADEYLACKINSCFSYDTEFEKVKKDIESLLKR